MSSLRPASGEPPVPEPADFSLVLGGPWYR